MGTYKPIGGAQPQQYYFEFSKQKIWPIVFLAGCSLLTVWTGWAHYNGDSPGLPELFSSPGNQPGPTGDDEGSWKSPWSLITPSDQLLYTPCFDGYQCARLEVPMDWNNTVEDEENVALAIIKLPAKVPITDPRYGGAIFMNPGGPGASGISGMLMKGRDIQMSVDSMISPELNQDPKTTSASASQMYYDIIGYDPRGVNNTTPQYECFTEPYSRQRWSQDFNFLDLLGTSDVATEQAWARAMALAATCTRDGGPRIGQFMNTTPHIADIIRMIERHGEWRERETETILASSSVLSESQRNDIRDTNRWKKDEESLQFWGFSYGTVIGATFAAMHPHRVKRLVLDGVCDAQSMYSGYWNASLLNTDNVVTSFLESCQEAGPEKCSFASGNSSETLRAKMDNTLEFLNKTPLVVPGSDTRGPEIITYSDVMRYIRLSVYRPIASFPKLADVLTTVSLGDGSLLADIKHAEQASVCPVENRGGVPNSCPPYKELLMETLQSTACTDGEDLSNLDKDDFLNYYQVLKGQSRWMSNMWASFTMPCWGWKTRPKWRYNGPISGNPAHPILWIGNTFDPATPVVNAHISASRFSGSVVLEQDSAGHCTIAAPSRCTAEHVRRYFQTGILPQKGTVCKPDKTAFGASSSDVMGQGLHNPFPNMRLPL